MNILGQSKKAYKLPNNFLLKHNNGSIITTIVRLGHSELQNLIYEHIA